MNDSDARHPDFTSTTLINRIKADQEEAWFELFRLYKNLFLHWIRQHGIEDEDASDILQEILIDVRRQIVRFQKRPEGRSFRPWLRTITTGKIGDFFAGRKKVPRTPGTDRLAELPPTMVVPEDEEEHAEKSLLLASALTLMKNSVAERDWNVFYQSVVCGRTSPDIAEEFDIKPGNVRIIRHRVMQKLRTEFGYLLD